MKWSWKLGRIAGIAVYMHLTFLILLGWVAISYYQQNHSWTDAVQGLGFVLILFGIVVLHELGHALTARRFGIATRDITLLPIGGVARLERMPEDPKQELLVALAGPAVNFALAAAILVLMAVLAPLSRIPSMDEFNLVGGEILAKLLVINVVLGVFNLIPAFPMDGGRVLRALLAIKMNYLRATEIAATTGQIVAFAFGFIGLFSNPFLVFIALFVWIGAAQESSMVMMKTALHGIPISHVMITDFRTLAPSDPLSKASDLILAGFQQDFPVVEDHRVVGLLTRSRLMAALAEHGENAQVGSFMEDDFQSADPSEMAQEAFQRLQTGSARTLPVVRDQALVGLVTTENLGEFLMIQKALREMG